MADVISGVTIPDSKIAREAAELVRHNQTEMLFNHSVRTYVFGAMKGIRQNLKFDSEYSMSPRCFTTWALSKLTKPRPSGLRSMALTPRANSSEVMGFQSRRRTLSGKRSPCTRRSAFPSTCGLKSHSRKLAWPWTWSDVDLTNIQNSSATRSSPLFRAMTSRKNSFSFKPAQLQKSRRQRSVP
jgi:hypothetical protein